MRASIFLSRFLALFLCIVFPLYLAIRGCASLSLLPSFSRAEALNVEIAPPTPSSKNPFEAKPPRATEREKRSRYPPLPNGLAHCINSFEQYPVLAEKVLQRRLERYFKQTPAQEAISNKLGYYAHFERARNGIEVNARFSEQIVQMAREHYRTGPQALEDKEDAELGVVSQAFGHLSRDWSTQGTKERQVVFPPILGALEHHFGEHRRKSKVLVPGSGTGRLASDIADLGASIILLC